MFGRFKSLLYRLIFFFILLLPISVRSEISPFNLYGKKIQFDVIRDGKIVGQHTTHFQVQADKLVIETQMNLKIKVFSISIYSFNYEATEIWKNDLMTNLDVTVLDNSERKIINAFSVTDGFSIKGPAGDFKISGPIISTNHWNVNVLKERRVLNTITGAVNQVQITNKGRERVSVKKGHLIATRYDYTGDLTNTSAWYDNEGRWVKLRFIARDGSTINYFCNTCDIQ